jgi:hypothetical protein
MAQIERDPKDKRFPASLREYLQGRALRAFDSRPSTAHLHRVEAFVMEEGGKVYLAVYYKGEIIKTELT